MITQQSFIDDKNKSLDMLFSNLKQMLITLVSEKGTENKLIFKSGESYIVKDYKKFEPKYIEVDKNEEVFFDYKETDEPTHYSFRRHVNLDDMDVTDIIYLVQWISKYKKLFKS